MIAEQRPFRQVSPVFHISDSAVVIFMKLPQIYKKLQIFCSGYTGQKTEKADSPVHLLKIK